MNVLAIDCCARGEASATRRLCERCLQTLAPSDTVETLRLYDEPLHPLLAEEIDRRAEAVASGALDDPLLRYARQFQRAEEIVIAAPYWDLSFPAILKTYLERVSVSGVTFRYEGTRPAGCCRAGRIVYFSTCGGFVYGPHLGVEYVRALAGMFGIPRVEEYRIEGLDIDPSRREALVGEGIERILGELATRPR